MRKQKMDSYSRYERLAKLDIVQASDTHLALFIKRP